MVQGQRSGFERLVRKYEEQASIQFGRALNLQLVRGERVSESRFCDDIWIFISYVLVMATTSYTTMLSRRKQREIARLSFFNRSLVTRQGLINVSRFSDHISGWYLAFCNVNFFPHLTPWSPTTTTVRRSRSATAELSYTCSYTKVKAFVEDVSRILCLFFQDGVV